MNAQAYRLKDAQQAARIAASYMDRKDRYHMDDDTAAYWGRAAGRAALSYLSHLAGIQDVDLEMVSLAIAALVID